MVAIGTLYMSNAHAVANLPSFARGFDFSLKSGAADVVINQ